MMKKWILILGLNLKVFELSIFVLALVYKQIPVVPHKAVAEVSKIGNL